MSQYASLSHSVPLYSTRQASLLSPDNTYDKRAIITILHTHPAIFSESMPDPQRLRLLAPAALVLYVVLWEMREAHFPQHNI
jgi:hypothetical protein